MRKFVPNSVICLCFLILGSTPGFCGSQEQCQKICGNFEETENARALVKEQNYRQLKTISIANDDTRKERVVNGYQPTKKRGFLVLIRVYLEGNENQHASCVGSIINDRFILTAGHCVCTEEVKEMSCKGGKITYEASQMKVYVGLEAAENVALIEAGHSKERDVEEVIIHPEWKGKFSSSGFVDLAMLKLKKKLKFGINVSPICLPFDKSSDISKVGYVAGWGDDSWKEHCFTDNRGPARNVPCLESFTFDGKTHDKCFEGKSPSDLNNKCVQFRTFSKYFDWKNTSHVVIRYNKGKRKTKCYPEDPGYGWCAVKAPEKQDGLKGLNPGDDKYITKGDNWGFCSKHCGDSEPKSDSQKVLQETQLELLTTEDCLLYDSSNPKLQFNKEIEVCAGMKHAFPTVKILQRKYEGKAKIDGVETRKYSYKLKETKPAHLNTKKDLQKLDYYLGFSDTCSGDSGGAFFQSVKGKFYLTGILSRGPTECGVMNVPGIYTSLMKKPVKDWILEHSKEGSCKGRF